MRNATTTATQAAAQSCDLYTVSRDDLIRAGGGQGHRRKRGDSEQHDRDGEKRHDEGPNRAGSLLDARVVVDTGSVGSGSGTVVMVGRGGMGTVSATAYPANRPEPASAIAAAATLTAR